MPDKQQIEAANWQMAHSWHTGLGLYYAGVKLGDTLTYDMLNVLGRIWKINDGKQTMDEGRPTTDDQANDTP